ncbi:MAG TPA: hypothetical protein VIP56_07735 [Nitrososphaeraceae archaeon]
MVYKENVNKLLTYGTKSSYGMERKNRGVGRSTHIDMGMNEFER